MMHDENLMVDKNDTLHFADFGLCRIAEGTKAYNFMKRHLKIDDVENEDFDLNRRLVVSYGSDYAYGRRDNPTGYLPKI